MKKYVCLAVVLCLPLFLGGCIAYYEDLTATIPNEERQGQYDAPTLPATEEAVYDIDFLRDFLRFAWIIDDVAELGIPALSFRLDEIRDGVIKGSICNGLWQGAIRRPPVFGSADDYILYEHNLLLTVLDSNIAAGDFEIGERYKGSISLEFMDNLTINATIEFTKQPSESHFLEGQFVYRPQRITDLSDEFMRFEKNEELSREINLNSWGDVVIWVGTRITNRFIPFVFIIDNEERILYEFEGSFPTHPLCGVTVEDLNGDELLDVSAFIYGGHYDGYLYWNFYQLENGWFWLEVPWRID